MTKHDGSEYGYEVARSSIFSDGHTCKLAVVTTEIDVPLYPYNHEYQDDLGAWRLDGC